MTVTQRTPNLHQLTRLGLVNCYLVREEDGFTLVDTGIPGTSGAILGAASAAGAPISRILLTHAHGDHIGSVDALAGRIPGVELAISFRDSRLLRKDRSLDPGEPQTRLHGSFPGTSTRPTRLLSEGDLVGSLRSVATPGHTPGHFSFLDERDGTLLAGDALVTLGGELRVVSDSPWFFPLPQVATWHAPTALASVGRLLDLPSIARIAPGHGGVLEGGLPALTAALDHASKA